MASKFGYCEDIYFCYITTTTSINKVLIYVYHGAV